MPPIMQGVGARVHRCSAHVGARLTGLDRPGTAWPAPTEHFVDADVDIGVDDRDVLEPGMAARAIIRICFASPSPPGVDADVRVHAGRAGGDADGPNVRLHGPEQAKELRLAGWKPGQTTCAPHAHC